ncbi:MAG: SNF2-related protein, partial [Halanaerobiales bacterium]
MASKMIDNKKYDKVGEVLRANIKDNARLSIASAYFTIYAYNNLKDELNKIEELRFLFTEPTFIKDEDTEKERREYYLERLNREKTIAGTKYELKLKNKLDQTKIARECALWFKDKAKVKSIINPELIDSKLFISENKDDKNIVIQGSSDFTSEGLGFTNSPKLDLNTYIENEASTGQYIEWFNEIWENEDLVEDVKEEVLTYIEMIYQENSPEYIYFVTLYNIFRDYLDELDEDNLINAGTGIKNSVIWNKLYSFQRDGVLGAIDKLEKYNGCIIADSVGLGKTFEALAIIKYYELRNDRVLVLCPKKLRENWTIYTLNDKRNLLNEDRFNFDVLNHTDLSRYSGMSADINLETINWGNYDLLVIDESHNFRNNPAVTDRETRYSRLMNEVIKSGVRTKVLMLSATPVNNRMNDLKNQIAFITEGDDRAFASTGIKSIAKTLRKAQYAFNKWQDKADSERTLETFLDMININYFKLLDTVTIARSRKHIEKYYDINEVGEFPLRLTPKNIYASVDIKDQFPSFEEINKEIKKLNLSIYSPLKYILLDKRQEYSKKYDKKVQGGRSVFKQVDRETSLVNLIRVNILKRMESSVYSFGVTIANILKQIDNYLDKIDNSDSYFDENLNINQIDIEDEEIEDMMIGKKVKILLQDMDQIKWRQDLEEDRIKLENLLLATAKVKPERDDKLEKLKEEIKNKVLNPINDNNKKIVIFSAFADTADYLYRNISDWLLENFKIHTALVTGSGGNQTTLKNINCDLNSILTNFAPRAKERDALYPELDEEIDILIATDCISEGQNLQDCDYLINYD